MNEKIVRTCQALVDKIVSVHGKAAELCLALRAEIAA